MIQAFEDFTSVVLSSSALFDVNVYLSVYVRFSPHYSVNILCPQANFNKVRMVFWSSEMKVTPSVTAESLSPPKTTRTDSSIIRTIALMAPEKFDNISPSARFYPGMRFLFSDNDTPWLGRRNNEECEAVAIITHADEPPDDLTLPYRTLLKMPLGIIVRPLAVVVEDLKVQGLPPGCIVVKPVAQKNGSTQVHLFLYALHIHLLLLNVT